MLRIYIGQDDRWEGKPLYEQIVLKLRDEHAAGATVHKGTRGMAPRSACIPVGGSVFHAISPS